MRFYIVDAFTDALFGGNPAGVVILDRNADFPSDEVMRKTAAELRYSETAFIQQLDKNEFRIRYFTPAAEVELCGHATIASFFALADAGHAEFGRSYVCNTLAGRLNIDLAEGTVFMDMSAPKAIGKIEDPNELHGLYSIMGIREQDQGEVSPHVLQEKDARGDSVPPVLFPELISTGLPDILLPVRSEQELAGIKPDFPALSKLSEKYEVVGVHAFTVNAEDGAIHCRNFAPLYEIDEEAATGTSNGALTYYLYKNGLLHEGSETLFIQGEAMHRPSKIVSRLTTDGGTVRIQIGGSAAILACGEINL